MASVTSLASGAGQSGPKPRAMSSGSCAGATGGKAGGKVVGSLSRRVYRPEDLRRAFPEQWQAWCCANFRNSVQCAAAFGVSEKTARLWMEGVNAPQGYAVAAAICGLVDGVPPFQLERAA